MVDGVLHGHTAAHRPAEQAKVIPAHGANKVLYIIGEVSQPSCGVNGQCRRVTEASEVRRQHLKILCQKFHHVLVKNGRGYIAVEQQKPGLAGRT